MTINNPATIQNKLKHSQFTPDELTILLNLGKEGPEIVGEWQAGTKEPTPQQQIRILDLPNKAPLEPQNKATAASFKFIDLFAGIGGIRLPFQELGGISVLTSEWDKFSQKTYLANFGELPKGDITKITNQEIPAHDLLLGGFPCQTFSQAGRKKGFGDTRGTMFFEIQRILTYHRPKMFLLENVKQLKGHDQGRTLKTILAILRGEETSPEAGETLANSPMSEGARQALSTKLNYQVGYAVLSAKNFGVPQNRERIYLLGFDRERFPETKERDLPQEIFDELLAVKQISNLGEILEKNATVDPKYTISDKLWAGHQRRLKEHRQKGNGFGYGLFNHLSSYSNTLSARYYKDGSEILIDQSDIGKNPRKLTPRECARLQGFPENFYLDAVSNVQNYRQFGNSVAVPVIRAITQALKPWLVEETAKQEKEAKNKL